MIKPATFINNTNVLGKQSAFYFQYNVLKSDIPSSKCSHFDKIVYLNRFHIKILLISPFHVDTIM